jgi:hypothetical protein
MMKKTRGWLAFVIVSLIASSAFALPQRTFVASTGSDANACSLTSPCRYFQAAVNAVAVGGEVVALDSSGYGPVAISQSVSIIAPPGVYAGISVSAGGNQTGVFINTSGVNVVLRGLTIIGIGGGIYGVWMVNGERLTIENCVISQFNVSSTGIGIYITAEAQVSIVGSTIHDSWQNIVVNATDALVNIADSQVLRSAAEGIEVEGGGPNGFPFTRISISDTLVTGDRGGICIDNAGGPGTTSVIEVTRVVVNNCTIGIFSEPAGTGTITVSSSTVTGNGFGFRQSSGVFQSLGNNQVSDNATDISGTITVIGAH